MHTLRQYLHTLDDPEGLTRTLRDLTPRRHADGRLHYVAGNSAVTFRVTVGGREKALRGYFNPPPHLRALYGERLLERELYLFTSPQSGEWVDVVVSDWIEGVTLDSAIRKAAREGDTATLSDLSLRFDRLALQLLREEWAHGDLKPENILLTAEGELRLIDFDACFLPRFAGERSREIGTAAFQHPTRDTSVFDRFIDDYPAALISTALHALCLDPSLLQRHPADGLLFDPRHIARQQVWDEVMTLFENRGQAAAYHIARMLLSPIHRLPRLADLLDYITSPSHDDSSSLPELYADDGLWGFRTPQRVVIPPLYHSGFDFTEGLAAVQLGHTWHFIDPHGTTQLSFAGCEAVKPFRNGRTKVLRGGEIFEYDSAGRLFEN